MYQKYKIKNRKLILNFFLATCIIISTCILSIGYAVINSTNLNIDLSASATPYAGMFISDVKYLSNNSADLTKSEILDYTGTMLHSNICLSATDTSSSITYAITIFNNSDATRKFTGVTYLESAYSNQNITYSINGLNINDIIVKGDSKTFDITFYYNNVSTITNNVLDSYLSFNFDYYLDGENEVDIYITSGETYIFTGVDEENIVSLQNIANISFILKNGSENTISGVTVDITYTTTTGSKQSASITLNDENGALLQTQTAQFLGKQTNTVLTITFNSINIANNEKLFVKFDQATITNGQVQVSKVAITPIFNN